MIIICNNCNKKFDLDSDFISSNGRLLQCGSCNHKWFFKKENPEKTASPIDNDSINIFNQNISTNKEKDLNEKIEIDTVEELETKIDNGINDDIPVITKLRKKKNFKILNILIVVLFSFVAFIIIVDTFKYPIGQVVPNIEFILYNLYESIKDISLFIRDLK